MDKEIRTKRPLDQEGEEQAGTTGTSKSAHEDAANPVVKRTRVEDTSAKSSETAVPTSSTVSGSASPGRSQPSSSEARPAHNDQQQHRHRPPVKSHAFFGTDVIDDVVQTVGEFLFEYCHLPNVEIEAKLGRLVDSATKQRINLPVRNEVVLAPQGHHKWYTFSSNMTIDQHSHFNGILNSRLQQVARAEPRERHITYQHTREIDQFFERQGKKARVTRDQKTNEVIPNGIVQKERIADLDIYSPRNTFDYRISVSTEVPVLHPQGEPRFERIKDRISYRQNNFKIDLTQVKNSTKSNGPSISSQMRPMQNNNNQELTHELEIEFVHPEELAREREIRMKRGPQPDRFIDVVGLFVNNIRGLVMKGNLQHQQQQQQHRPRG
ncbi:CYTH-like domain-containing protein [Mortierella sp. GBAus27b]|nr:mRNA-capping enzyme subunit beta [Mortierella sp. GBA43]KAI8353771.1 CYTH-like domain-containing protein [Mortierella sp. GBAus27b]